MKISISGDFIIKDFVIEDLPDFVVITGANGSGKSRLLKSISDFDKFKTTNNDVKNGLFDENGDKMGNFNYIPYGVPEINTKLVDDNEVYDFWRQHLATQTEQLFSFFVTEKRNNDRKNYSLYQSLLSISQISHHDNNLSFLFLSYFLRNRIEAISNYEENAPWTIFNNLLKKANLNYSVTYPPNYNTLNANLHSFPRELGFEAMFKKDGKDFRINFKELSSGERSIISLIYTLFNHNSSGRFANVMLYDEPDSTLHPSFVKNFLDVLIKNEFIKEKGIKIIITTHSPTTVALSPPGSIYVMRDGELTKTTKREAIKALTYGLKDLSILYEHRKQVLVEGNFDALFYENVFSYLSEEWLSTSMILNFISCGKFDGGSSKVIDFTKKFNDTGNKSVCGILDRDGIEGKTKVNTETDRIKILGQTNRYSVENYVLDPLLVGILLIREKLIGKEKLGIDNKDNVLKVEYFDSSKLQIIVSSVLSELEINLPKNVKRDNDLVTIKLICEKEISLPKWFLNHNGHELEELYKKTFIKLLKYSATDKLKEEILEKVIELFPQYLPIDFMELFERIEAIPTE